MATIQQKRGSSDRWLEANPILAAGEIGYETDTGKFKIGDGSLTWSSLSYFSTSSGGSGSGTLTSVGLAVPTGLTVSNSPLTADGTITIAYDTGYSIPLTADVANGVTAYGWGNHASAGYQPGDADLTAIAALTADGLLRKTSGTWGMDSATYLTSYTETDTLSSVTGRGATTNTAISITNNTSSTNTTTGALKVTGGVGIQENLNVGGDISVTGNLTVFGSTTTINSTVVTIDDPIFTLGGDTAPGSDDNKDRGIAFRWHNGATAKIGFFGFDDSSQQFTFIPDATITSEVVSGTVGTFGANATSANILSTARNIWGQSFDGSGDVTGSLTNVGDITSSDTLFSIGTTSVTTVSGNAIAITGGTTSNTVGTGGAITLTGGSATSSTGANFGGNINIAAGASTLSTSGTGGSVSILAGNGQTKGTISIGTSNTSGITIGASGITTTIAGTLSATLSTLTISSPLSGTSYNGSSAVSIGLANSYGDTLNPYGSKSINTVLAGPSGGVSGSPTFRSLVSADIPDLSGTYAALAAATNTFTGDIAVNGGDITSTASSFAIAATSTTGTSGRSISLLGGASTSTGIANGGTVTITGGAATSGTTASSGGSITITAGASNATSGAGGNVTINAGAGSVANGNGNIYIGTSNTDSITIGASGKTTTIAGTLSASFSTLTISSPLSGTSYNGSSNVSIGLSSNYGDTQNPYGTKTANYVLAGPVSGPNSAPTFRALTSTDIPDLSGTYLAVGATAANSTSINIASTTGNTSDTTLYPVFVGNAATGAQNPHIDSSGIVYNASTDSLSLTGDLTVSGGDITLGSAGTATTIKTLATTGSASGNLTISTGDTTSSGASGNITVDVGNGATSDGTISIGNTYASAITIGRAGITTTIAGTLSATVPTATNANNINITTTDGNTSDTTLYPVLVAANTTGNQAPHTDVSGITYNSSSNELATGSISLTGDIAVNGGDITTTATALTLNATLKPRTGHATNGAPIQFTSGANLTTPVAGALEFDGKAMYITPSATPGRALIPSYFYKVLSADNTSLINVSPGVPTTYSAFGTNGIQLESGVAYEVEMLLMMQASAASNSCTLVISPGAPPAVTTATPSSSQLYFDYSASTTVMTNAAATSAVMRTGTTTFPALNTITIATGATQYIKAFMKGVVRITTAGYFTMRLAFTPTSPGTVTGTIYAGSYIKIIPIGIEGVTDVGIWA